MARPTLPASATVGDPGHTTDHNTIRGALAALYEEHTEGTGSPEGAVTATVGRTYSDTTGGVLYVKATGSGNTGWVEVGTGTGGAVAPTNLLTANQAEPASATGWEAVTNCTVTWVGGTGLVVESLAAGAVLASTLEDTDGVVPTPGEQWVTGHVWADNEGSSVTEPVAIYLKGWVGVGSDTVKVAEDVWMSVPMALTGATNFDRNDSDPDYDYLAVQVGWTAAAAGEQLVILKAGLWHGVGGMWMPPGDHTIPGQPAIEGLWADGAVPARVANGGVVEWKELAQAPIDETYITSGAATDGHVLTADGAGGAAWEAAAGGGAGATRSIRSECIFPEGLAGTTNHTGNWDGLEVKLNGTGTAVTNGTSDAAHPGVLLCSTGTTTTGRCGIGSNGSVAFLGSGAVRFESVLKLTTLSDGTQTFTALTGLTDSVASITGGGTAFFRYQHSVYSGNWQIVTTLSSTENPQDSGVAADTDWHTFAIEVNADATSVEFFIDGASVGTSTSQIPTGGMRIMALNLIKSAGSTARTASLDWFSLTYDI